MFDQFKKKKILRYLFSITHLLFWPIKLLNCHAPSDSFTYNHHVYINN